MVTFDLAGSSMFGGMDGAVDSFNAASGIDLSMFAICVGGNGGIPFLNGTSTALNVAEVSAWTTRLGIQETQALYQGVSPLRLGVANSLVSYYPLRDSLLDYGPSKVALKASSTSMTPVWRDHPPAEPIRAKRTYLLKTSGGGPSPLSATLVSALADAILTASGSVGISAAVSQALADGSLAGLAAAGLSGGLSQAEPPSVLSGSGGSLIGAGLSQPITSASLSGSALAQVAATLAKAIDDAILASAGTSAIGARLVEAMADANLVGLASSLIGGGLSESLDPMALAAIANIITGADATLLKTLDPMALTAAGTVSLAASLLESVGTPLSGLGRVGINAGLSESLTDNILAGLAIAISGGSASATLFKALQDARLIAAGAVSSSALLSAPAIIESLSGTASVALAAALMEALDPATLIALASIGGAIRLTRPRAGRMLIVPADRRTLIVPADRRILPPGV
jgi:hypothetical protein